MLIYSLLLLFIKVLLIIFLIYFLYYFTLSFGKGVPYAPSKKSGVNKMIEMADVQLGEKAIDIGSGDGRIVAALAKAGAKAYGIEINKLLVWFSGVYLKSLGLENKTFIMLKDFWVEDYSSYDVITIFAQPYIMEKLEEKIFNDVKPGTRIVVNRYKFPNKEFKKEDCGIYLYIK
jgi:protein-L-isoaspartate O-methyltransferase